MAKPKVLSISGPIDAKHVSGINVSGDTRPSRLDSYFDKSTIQPDTLPSHTFVAVGKTEVPRRSDTIVETIRRPSVSLRRSLSRLSRRSISHISELHHRSSTSPQASMSVARSESANGRRPLRMQSSMSRLRQKVGLDRETHHPMPMGEPAAVEVERVLQPVPKHEHTVRPRMSSQRMGVSAPRNSTEQGTDLPRAPTRVQSIQSIHSIKRKPSSAIRPPSNSSIRPHSTERQTPPAPSSAPPPPPPPPSSTKPLVRPKRADSGAAMGTHDRSIDDRPLGFKEILAVPNYSDRMKMYQKAREYWAHADHGLTAWTEGALAPKMLAATA